VNARSNKAASVVRFRPAVSGRIPFWTTRSPGLDQESVLDLGRCPPVEDATRAVVEFGRDLVERRLIMNPQACYPVLLTAVVIVADWIASDVQRFPYRDSRSSDERAAQAWDSVGLTPSWAPEAQHSTIGALSKPDSTFHPGRWFDLCSGQRWRSQVSAGEPAKRWASSRVQFPSDCGLFPSSRVGITVTTPTWPTTGSAHVHRTLETMAP